MCLLSTDVSTNPPLTLVLKSYSTGHDHRLIRVIQTHNISIMASDGSVMNTDQIDVFRSALIRESVAHHVSIFWSSAASRLYFIDVTLCCYCVQLLLSSFLMIKLKESSTDFSFTGCMMQISIFYYFLLHFLCAACQMIWVISAGFEDGDARMIGWVESVTSHQWWATAVAVSMMDNSASRHICDALISLITNLSLWASWRSRADWWSLLNCFPGWHITSNPDL